MANAASTYDYAAVAKAAEQAPNGYKTLIRDSEATRLLKANLTLRQRKVRGAEQGAETGNVAQWDSRIRFRVLADCLLRIPLTVTGVAMVRRFGGWTVDGSQPTATPSSDERQAKRNELNEYLEEAMYETAPEVEFVEFIEAAEAEEAPAVVAQEEPRPEPQAVPAGMEAVWDALGIRTAMAQLSQRVIDEAVEAAKRNVHVVKYEIHNRNTGKTHTVDGHKHEQFETILDLAQAGMAVMMVGPTGSGKTHLAGQIAEALGVRFGSISVSEGMSESHLLGWLLPTGDAGKFEHHPATFAQFYEEGGLFLEDEKDAGDANTQIVTNAAMANGHLDMPKRFENPVAKRSEGFYPMSACNTFGTGADRMYVGRNQMDEATLNRWIQVDVNYDRKLESALFGSDTELLHTIWGIREKIESNNLRRVASTRDIKHWHAVRAMHGADRWPIARVLGHYFLGWSDADVSRVGYGKD